MLPLECAKDGCLNIDGFNLIVHWKLHCQEAPFAWERRCIQGLAGLRHYRLIDKTDTALNYRKDIEIKCAMGTVLFGLSCVQLRQAEKQILGLSEQWGLPVEVELVPNVDVILSDKKSSNQGFNNSGCMQKLVQSIKENN